MTLYRFHRDVGFFVVVSMVILLSFPLSSIAVQPEWHQQSINVESKVGTDRSIQSLDVMFPLSYSQSSLLFTDLRGRIDDDQSVEVNLGLAQRFVTNDPVGLGDEAVIGFYGFADRLESRFNNTFYQGTIGAEYFTKNYSLRVNGYMPENDRKPTTSFTQLEATGTQIFFEDRRNFERPLPGYDVELGRTLRFDGWQLYGRGSYFRFHHSDVAEVEGSRFRAGVQLSGSTLTSFLSDESQLTLGTEWQNDSVRDEQTFGVMRMRIPFGSSVEGQKSNVENKKPTTDNRPPNTDSGKSAWVYDRLTERIERDVDIVTGNRTDRVDTDPARLSTTGETVTSAAVAGEGRTGSGTFNDPGSLASAVNTAGTDGTVFVLGDLKTEGVVVPGGQRIVNGGLAVFQSPDGRYAATLGSSDTSATIEGTASQSILQLATGTSGQTVRGLTLTGGKHAIKAEDVDDLTIKNVRVTSTDSDAIDLNSTNNASIDNSTIEGTLDAGDDFGGKVTSSQVDELKVGADASGRISDVTVTDGNMTVGDDAGRGAGNRFALKRVTVESGNLVMGENAAAENGILRMDTVTVSNGFLDLGDHAAGDPTGSNNGGVAKLTNITTGDTLSVGAGAGIENGSFTMMQVQSGGTVTIDPSAGEHGGSFTMEGVSSDGALEIGSSAGANSGSFTMTDVTSGGTIDIGDNAARDDGAFSMKKVDVSSGNLLIGENAGRRNGTFRMADVSLDTGGLIISQRAGSEGGSLRMDTVSARFIHIGRDAGGDPSNTSDGGTVKLNTLTASDTLHIGPKAGSSGGSFSLSGVETGDSLTLGLRAGWDNGSFRLTDAKIGDDMDVGEWAGRSGGSFVLGSSNITGNLDINQNFGEDGSGRIKGTRVHGQLRTGNTFSGALLSDTVGSLDIGDDATGRVEDVTVTAGGFTVGDSLARGTGNSFVMKGVDVLNGDVSIGNHAARDTGTVQITDLSVDSGSFSVGNNAGRRNGSITLDRVDASDDISIGNDAGRLGSFAMTADTAGNHIIIGDRAGYEGSFTMNDVEAVSGDVTVGDGAGQRDGSFSMKSVTAGDSLSIGDDAGDNGTAILTDVTTGDSLTVGDNAGYNGLFEIQSSQVGSNLKIGPGFSSGSKPSSGFVRNTTISGSLDIGHSAAFLGQSTVGILNNIVQRDFILGSSAALTGEIYIKDNVIYRNVTNNSSGGNFVCNNNVPSLSCP